MKSEYWKPSIEVVKIMSNKQLMFNVSGNGDVGYGGEAGDKTTYYFGDDNKIYYPSEATTINAFRNYFKLKNIDTSVQLSIDLEFDDETDVKEVKEVAVKGDSNIYNLSGQRVSDAYKGIVIKGGRAYLMR